MSAISEEAVFAAAKAITGPLRDPTEWELTQFRLAITAALPHLPGVGVKKLEWDREDNGEFIAISVGGWYHIGLPHRTWNLSTPQGNVFSFETLEAAKEAAQAHYDARILSQIEVADGGRAEALEEGFRKGLEAACEVIDAHSEYDRQMCCDGRECGCYGATVHQSMQHYIRALSSPDHADAGKVEGDGAKRTEFNRGYVLACANIVNLHGADVAVMEGFAQLGISKTELKALELCDYDQRAIDALEDYFGADKLYRTSAPTSEGARS